MKTIVFLFFFLVTLTISAQSRKGIEVPNDRIMSQEERQRLELKEDLRIRQEWDRQEQEARAREEQLRLKNLERAESDEVPDMQQGQ